MKAMLCKQYGPAEVLVYEDIESRPLGKNEVRIAVRAGGVNFADRLAIKGQYQFKPDFPFSPGAEAAGDVTEIGARVNKVNVGDRVVWHGLFGGYAEEIIADESEVSPIFDSLDYETAAGMFLTYGTSYHGLVQRAEIQPGETLLVLAAAGGVGRALGARVIAAASSDEKLDLAKRFGAEMTINYSAEDIKQRTKELTNCKGVDVIYDPVGGELFEQSLRAIAPKGRMLEVGFASGEIPKMAVILVLLKSCQVVGVFYGQFRQLEPELKAQNVRDLVQMIADGKLNPLVSKTYPLEKAVDALNDILTRKVLSKVVLTTGRG